MFSIESSIKDFSLNKTFEYPIKTIPKVISKSKSTSLNETYIKNVCDTPSKQNDKDTKCTKNKSTQNSESFSDNMKETINKFIDDLVEGEETILGDYIRI